MGEISPLPRFPPAPELPEIAGVQQNVCRAWKPQHARDPDDERHRAGKTLKILRTMEWANRRLVQQDLRELQGLRRPTVPAHAFYYGAVADWPGLNRV